MLSPYPARRVTVDFRREVRGREVRGAFDDAEDISTVPTPFTPACYGHSLAPIGGPIVVRNAKPRDVVAIDLIELAPFGTGKSAILRGGIAPRDMYRTAGGPVPVTRQSICSTG